MIWSKFHYFYANFKGELNPKIKFVLFERTLKMLYIFAIIKRNHFKMYMFDDVGEIHAHDYFEVISFYNSKDI